MATMTATTVLEKEKPPLELAISGSETFLNVFKEKMVLDDSNNRAQTKDKDYGTLLDMHGNKFIPPDYTIKQIYEAIPAECFERNILTSTYHVVKNLVQLATIFYVFKKYLTEENVPSYYARFALWSLYTFMQGICGLGLWVLGHDAGHMAFSKYKWLNDTVGWTLHSALLVPYFSWKITHRNHHKGIANMFTDNSWVPFTRLAYSKYFSTTFENVIEYAEDTPIYTFFYLLAHQLLVWPIYMSLMCGVGDAWFEKQEKMRGNPNPTRNEDGTIVQKYEFKGSHMNPYSPHFTPRDAKFIFITDIGLAITWASIYYVGSTYGWANVAVWYGIPYLWVNHWLLAITFLHHVDGSLAHYNPKQWNFVRGAASTIDRNIGFVDSWFFHNIIGTHVLHHHVSMIPHYHAAKASAAIKPVMGMHYREDKTGVGMWNFMKNLWINSKACSWVEPSEGAIGEGRDILFYRNRIGVGIAPMDVKLKAA